MSKPWLLTNSPWLGNLREKSLAEENDHEDQEPDQDHDWMLRIPLLKVVHHFAAI
jgi:hypothetical protein